MSKRNRYIVIVGVVVAGITTLSWWARQPSVSKPAPTASQVKAATTDDVTSYQNDYISMQLPKRFVAKQPNVGSGKPLYIQQLLTVPLQEGGGIFSDQLAIVVGVMPQAGITELSDVHLRARSPEYVAVVTNNATMIAYESNKQSTYEIGYFIGHGDTYASVVLTTSAAESQKARELVKHITESLVWR